MILASKELMAGTDVFFHVLGYICSILRRVCRSAIHAETYNIQYAVESGDIIRSGIPDMHGKLDHRNWEDTAAPFMHTVWLAACESARAAVRMSDKRVEASRSRA